MQAEIEPVALGLGRNAQAQGEIQHLEDHQRADLGIADQRITKHLIPILEGLAMDLAAALRAGRLRDEAFLTGVTLVCADDALNAAAAAEGLAVLNPITYAP